MKVDLSQYQCRSFIDGGGLYDRDICARCSGYPVAHDHLVIEHWSPSGPFQYSEPVSTAIPGIIIEKMVSDAPGQTDAWLPTEAAVRGRPTDWGTYEIGELP